jgi:hypothetical protein
MIPLMIDHPHAQDEIEEARESVKRQDSHWQEREARHLQHRLKQRELQPTSLNGIKADGYLWIQR